MNMIPNEITAEETRIRRAERRDGPRLLEMIAGLAEHHGDAPTVSARTLERDLFGPSACAVALVAERGGEVAGYALLTIFPHLHFGLRLMDLAHLYVAPDRRRLGIGRHLIAAAVAEAQAQGCGRLVVGTHPENRKAQEIYTALGFLPQTSTGPRFRLDLPESGALPEGWI